MNHSSEERSFQETKIVQLLNQLDSLYFQYSIESSYDHLNRGNSDKQDGIADQFKSIAPILYNIIIVYIEKQNIPSYLSIAKSSLEGYLTDFSELLRGQVFDINGDDYSCFTYKCYEILSPFMAFDYSLRQGFSKHIGLTYVRNILSNTHTFISSLRSKGYFGEVNSETKVYNLVKPILEAAFTDLTCPPNGSFASIAKSYKPDILIPSLKCAIEFKYALSKKSLVNQLDEIVIDVKGYGREPKYKFFFAVFYVTTRGISKAQFDVLWAEKEFPDNWAGIFVPF